MDASELIGKFSVRKEVKAFSEDAGYGKYLAEGINSSALSFFISSVSGLKPGIDLVIMSSREEAEYMTSDLYGLCGENVCFLPSSAELSSAGILVEDKSLKVQRTSAIEAVSVYDGKKSLVIVAYPHAVMEGMIRKDMVSQNRLVLKKGDEISREYLKGRLLSMNFEKVEFVSQPGEFALRGSIVDIFSYSDNFPYRIDFFGDEIESIKKFDINTQRSVDSSEVLSIVPDISSESGMVSYVSVFDYASDECFRVYFDDFDLVKERMRIISESSLSNYLDMTYLLKRIEGMKTVSFRKTSDSIFSNASLLSFNIVPQPVFNKNFELLADNLRECESKKYDVYVLSDNQSQIDRLKSILVDNTFRARFIPVPVSLHEGFVDNDIRIAVYTDHQIFNRYHRVRMRKSVEKSERITINDLSAFQIGDYIVHIDHGVGVYGGLVKTEVNGKIQEAVKLIYKDKDVIFVSVHSLHRISRYRSKDGTPPKIYKLGTGAWQKLKTQTKKKVKDIARDLIKLYSERRNSKGFSFSPDTYMQHELEASFIYEDTPDQSRATQAVKEDMEKDYPMDRLVCGDVGFGKTEVAIRAAFKAVADSKQVAVLVPTTILALQHYNTFRSRLKNFPCNIEFLSRLRTSQEIKQISSKLREGKIDIIIGTHRLLNKEIVFKDLGLLIIDEEQKFGVAAKEKLRQLKISVDTLTLTATPIPRTLQFSLLGARDLSIINTPPPNRLPVFTEIISFDEDLIRNIIKSEIDRGGQVYFVHNRVEDILSVEDMIRRLVPEATTCVGHGQMDPSVLEKRILDFIAGDYDVLISTTIVENGIDVPNANTILVNQAQNFGLSDLHQLRGRVGRSNRKAYCYLITPPMISVTDDARRRLKAIETFSDLGSGFNIAMQDLDIRGAGNLLGGEQSGFIADMGFETYQRILSEAFAEIKAESGDDNDTFVSENENFKTDPVIDADMELVIPDDYVSNTAEKIRLYKELDSLERETDIIRFSDSVRDRFGAIPKPFADLIDVVRLRREASRLSMDKVVLKNGIMLAYFISDPVSPFYQSEKFGRMIRFINERADRLRLKERNNRLYISVPDVKSVKDACKVLENINI